MKVKKIRLNLELFIARRLNKTTQGRKHFSNSITSIVVAGIVLSTAVMIVAVAIVTGFKEEIRNKVVGFGSHIQVLNYDSNLSYQTRPVPSDIEILDEIKAHPGVKHVQPFAIVAGVVKTPSDIQGLVLKGIDSTFDWSFFEGSLLEGSSFRMNSDEITNKIVVSSFLATKLNLSVEDELQMWFVDERPRFRKFVISGIYETSLAEFDETFALADLRHVEKLNNWEEGEISGFEIVLENFKDIEDVTWDIREIAAGYYFDGTSRVKVQSITERYPQIFDWLELQDLNVVIILALMLVVAGFNMVSGLLILILDRTYMIGVLKALGGKNALIRKIFLYKSGYLIFRGLFWGNVIGIGLGMLQKKYSLIELNPENYYLTTVPVNVDLMNIVLINAGTALAILLFLILPSMMISRIYPSNTLSFK